MKVAKFKARHSETKEVIAWVFCVIFEDKEKLISQTAAYAVPSRGVKSSMIARGNLTGEEPNRAEFAKYLEGHLAQLNAGDLGVMVLSSHPLNDKYPDVPKWAPVMLLQSVKGKWVAFDYTITDPSDDGSQTKGDVVCYRPDFEIVPFSTR